VTLNGRNFNERNASVTRKLSKPVAIYMYSPYPCFVETERRCNN